MLNRKYTLLILFSLNFLLTAFVLLRYGAASVNNWMLILSVYLFSAAIYRILGMVEGYR
ncbi:MAG: hypothetical protein J0L99_20390 [Chitinophagales bacterium]|jgi:hypothetical protein|nr:hypothetical protein [Chitinophagales bacterium]